MALQRLGILSLQNARRVPAIACRWKQTSEKKPTKWPAFVEHATGLERRELEAILTGNEDPFGLGVYKRGPGTKENPNIVPSIDDKRIIGCICEEDSTVINWMWVHMDEPKRCGCGYWWKLQKSQPL